MSEPRNPDEEMMDELRSVLRRADPIPPEVTDSAKGALGWRRIDAELAELLADSALETESAALTRSGGGSGRWLTFRAGELAIDVEVEADDATRTLLGQLAPPALSAIVEVHAADGSVSARVEADSLGRFRFALGAGGRVRLVVLRYDPPGAPIETSWFSL